MLTQTNITYKSTMLITDLYQSRKVSCFCACGKIDLSGVCLPVNNAPAPALAIIGGMNDWVTALIDPRTGEPFEIIGRSPSPCIAISTIADASARLEVRIGVEFFTDSLSTEQWMLLIEKKSEELYWAGRNAAIELAGVDAEPAKPAFDRSRLDDESYPTEWDELKRDYYQLKRSWDAWSRVRTNPVARAGWEAATSEVVEQPAEEIIEERTIGGVDYTLKRLHDTYIVEETIIGAVFSSDPPYDSLTEARFAFEYLTGQAVAQAQDFGRIVQGRYDNDTPVGYDESTQPYLY